MSRIYVNITPSDQIEADSLGPEITPRPDAWIRVSDELQIWAETSELMDRLSQAAAETATMLRAYGK